MALITGRDSFDGGRPLSESEWTLELLRLNEAELAESEIRWREASAEPVLQAPPEPPPGGLYAHTRGEASAKPSQSPPPDRGRTLRERAKRLTRKSRADES
jgi:hypothetical protein